MSIDAHDEIPAPADARVVWFRTGGDRPVNGSGNTVFVRPADHECDGAAPPVAIELQ